jgi:uncharacterized metal-binding protein
LIRLKAGGRPADDTALFSGPPAPTVRRARRLPAAAVGTRLAMDRSHQKPLVYSCSGCSSAAQLANAVALKLDRADIAEMSCIAGIGGDVPSLLRTARSGRPIVALDGCALACVKNALARHELQPRLHVMLSEQGVRKRHHADFDPVQAQRVFANVSAQIARSLSAGAPKPAAPKLAEGACS